jgi:chemotaxis protein histidine kinase CheA
MDSRKAPAAADLAVLDPDGSFICRLRGDWHTLASLEDGLWAMPEDTRRLRLAQIEELAHRLAGAAGTFGYERVGIAAFELESCMAAAPGAKRPENKSAIEFGIVGLRTALESSLRKS